MVESVGRGEVCVRGACLLDTGGVERREKKEKERLKRHRYEGRGWTEGQGDVMKRYGKKYE